MSIRYTGMFVSSVVAPDTLVFSTKAVQITGVPFSIGAITIAFNTKAIQITGVPFSIDVPVSLSFGTKALQITGNTFTVDRGHINHDNGFMAF